MAIFKTDLAYRQTVGSNFPGEPGLKQILSLPAFTGQTNALFEGPPQIVATYTMVGTEAAGDTILIGKLEPGVIVDPNGKLSTGIVALAATLTVAVGDNDLGDPSLLPIQNTAALISANPNQPVYTAPIWVSGTTYVLGNVVRDNSASSGSHVLGDTYTCVTATTSAATAPSAAATTVWMPNRQRYSGSVTVAAATLNSSFAGGTQMYGGPASQLPYSVTPGLVVAGYNTNENLNQQYQIQNDCWLFARILTSGTPVAGTFLTFRVPLLTAN